MIGTPSELHELKDIMIFSHQDYIWGVIKHEVLSPVIDRIKLGSTNGGDNLVYVHYEKIGRICLLCGVMFHIAGNYFMRQGLVTHRMRAKESAQEIPFQRYGQWIIDDKKVPLMGRTGASPLSQGSRLYQNPRNADNNRLIMAPSETLSLPDEEAITNAMKRMEMSWGKSHMQDPSSRKNSDQSQRSTATVIAGDQRTHTASVGLAMQDAHVHTPVPAWEVRGTTSQSKATEGNDGRQQSLRREQSVMPERTV
jgi:hypothetical protein